MTTEDVKKNVFSYQLANANRKRKRNLAYGAVLIWCLFLPIKDSKDSYAHSCELHSSEAKEQKFIQPLFLGKSMKCPCGSEVSFDLCCGPYLARQKKPCSPEALMRSRYVAFTKNDLDYIKQTMRGRALETFNEVEKNALNQEIRWLGLEILETSATENEGIVTFQATFCCQGKLKKQVETSLFHKIDGTWYYVDALSISRVDCLE